MKPNSIQNMDKSMVIRLHDQYVKNLDDYLPKFTSNLNLELDQDQTAKLDKILIDPSVTPSDLHLFFFGENKTIDLARLDLDPRTDIDVRNVTKGQVISYKMKPIIKQFNNQRRIEQEQEYAKQVAAYTRER